VKEFEKGYEGILHYFEMEELVQLKEIPVENCLELLKAF